ncbi:MULTISPECIES: hypothetical protein [Sphingobacterium]|uniref:hypothetical protein n=1 Tax=Sphingobacterium TaxID=28453 RepID=UPI00257CAC93|nr:MULTISPECIES: hypothetical protein [Sphingobacterium]
MKELRLLLFILFIGLGISHAQTNKNYVIDLPSVNQDTTFENVLHLLLSSDYFVLSADKDSGLIQCKIVKDDRKAFSKLEVDILEYNLLIRDSQGKGTRIYIQANLKQKIHKILNNEGIYYDDNGVTKEAKHYESLIEFLKSHLI